MVAQNQGIVTPPNRNAKIATCQIQPYPAYATMKFALPYYMTELGAKPFGMPTSAGSIS